MNLKQVWTKRERMQLLGLMLILMLTSMLLLTATGCTTVHEIDSNRQVITVHAGIPFTPPVEGKFVPSARFDEMLDVYVRASWQK